MSEHKLTSMTSRANSGVKHEADQDQTTNLSLLRSPYQSLTKQGSVMPSQNKSAVKTPKKQESVRNIKVPIQQFDDTPPTDEINSLNFITMGRFEMDSTSTQVRVFTWLLLLNIKIVSLVTAAAFWLATIAFFKSLTEWHGPLKALYFALKYLSGFQTVDGLWRHILLGSEYLSGPHLRLAVHTSNYVHSPAIYSTSIPIIHNHPFVWLFVMTLMFISHYFTCFAHDCLSKLSPTIRRVN